MGQIKLSEVAEAAVGELRWRMHQSDRRGGGWLGGWGSGDEQAVEDGCAGGVSGDDDLLFEEEGGAGAFGGAKLKGGSGGEVDYELTGE